MLTILVAGSYFHAHEYARQDTVSKQSQMRLCYGARLQLTTLVTGGKPPGTAFPKRQMRTHYYSTAAALEKDASNDTIEGALHSFSIQAFFSRHGSTKFISSHTPCTCRTRRRCLPLDGFERLKHRPLFTTRYQTDLLAFLPRADALRDSKVFVHKVIGLFWYRVKSAMSK